MLVKTVQDEKIFDLLGPAFCDGYMLTFQEEFDKESEARIAQRLRASTLARSVEWLGTDSQRKIWITCGMKRLRLCDEALYGRDQVLEMIREEFNLAAACT